VDRALDQLIPKHKVNLAVDFQVTQKVRILINYQYVDSRNDAFFDGNKFTATSCLGSISQILQRDELIKTDDFCSGY
jgi:vitamin B12 transporter